MRVFDVGANIGYFSALALACVGPSGHVWAIEPNAANVRLLEITRRENKAENLSIVPAAAGDNFGPPRLDAPFYNGMVTPLRETKGDLSGANIVFQIRLDSILDEGARVDFIKLDVEGSEYRALKGFERSLDRWSQKLVFEFAPGMLHYASRISGPDFLRYLLDKGYSIGVIDPHGSTTLHNAVEPIMLAYNEAGIDHLDLFGTTSRISN
jgi:FkbM family methyltransferase